MAREFIEKQDTLNDGREKLNKSITRAYDADEKSDEAVQTSNEAKNISQTAEGKADSVQNQFNQVVIDGDSSVEAAQARVGADGTTYPVLKERLDEEHEKVTEQLSQIAINVKSYGAKGDGITNDINAFRQAIDEAPAGSTILIPASDQPYIWNPEFSHNGSQVCLQIDKPLTIISNGAEIKLPDFFDNSTIRRLIRISSDDVVIEGIKLNPNTDNQYKVDGAGYKWWWAEEGDTDILVDRTDVIDIQAPASKVKIINNHFYTGYTGVRFSGYDFFTNTYELDDNEVSTNCEIRGNTFERLRGNAINQSGGSRYNEVINNNFINNYYHSYRNYYGNQSNICRGNLFFRDFNEMGKQYETYDNRYFRTNNREHSKYIIERGHVRVGRGNEYSRYIKDIQIIDNTFITKPENEGTIKIYDDSNLMMTSILNDFTDGGTQIKQNTIDNGGLPIAGIMLRNYIELDSTPSYVIENHIENSRIGVELDNQRAASAVPMFVYDNTHKNVSDPLKLNDVVNFNNLNMKKKDLVISSVGANNAEKADIIIQEGDEYRFLQNAFNALFKFEEIVFLNGRFELDNELVLRRKINLINRNSEFICLNTSGDNAAFISIRYENVKVDSLTLKNNSSQTGIIGLELRDGNSSRLINNDVDGFPINYHIRNTRNGFVNKNISRNSTHFSFVVGGGGQTVRQIVLSENIIETSVSGKDIKLYPESNRAFVYGNILNGGQIIDEGSNNVTNNNLP